MLKQKVQQDDRLQEFKLKEAETTKRESELRQMIRGEKTTHREMSVQKRSESKEENKIFSKFINAHDEKEILRSHASKV